VHLPRLGLASEVTERPREADAIVVDRRIIVGGARAIDLDRLHERVARLGPPAQPRERLRETADALAEAPRAVLARADTDGFAIDRQRLVEAADPAEALGLILTYEGFRRAVSSVELAIQRDRIVQSGECGLVIAELERDDRRLDDDAHVAR